MENAVQKKGVVSTIGRALWIRQSSSISSAVIAFAVNAITLMTLLINFRYSSKSILEWFFGPGEFRHSIGQFLDVATVTLCGFNILDAWAKMAVGMWTNYATAPVPLTPVQRKLLGIAEDDMRFQATSTPASATLKRTDSASPFSFGDLSWLFHLTPKKRRSPGTPGAGAANSSSYNFYTTGLGTSASYCTSPSPTSPFRVRFSPSISNFNYQMATAGDTSFEDALESIRRRGVTDMSPMSVDERSPLRSILKKTGAETALNTSVISDHSTKSFKSWRSPSGASAPAQSPAEYRTRSVVFEAGGVSPAKSIDFSSLSSYRYQPAQNVSIDSSTGGPATGLVTASAIGSSPSVGQTPGATADSASPVWGRYGIASNEVVEEQSLQLRLWISSTILKALISEIDSLNAKAAKSASISKTTDFVIGESSLLHLQLIAASKFEQYPTLGALLPYLELSSNQGYLLERLRELGERDACLKDFRWNSGSQYKNKPWDDRLPSDSDLIMHLFSTYLNSRLPLNPLCPEGKSFSCLFFVQHPEKPPADRRKGYLAIYQNANTPPNFQLLVDDEILDVGKGKNNLFATLLLFFHHLKSKCGARLDTLTLGKSGLNVLWILD